MGLSVTTFNGFLPSCKGPRSDSRYRYFRFAQLDLSQFFPHVEISQSVLIAKKITNYHYCVQSVCIRSFLARISHIWIRNGEIFRISPYSVQMWENSGQNNSKYGQFSRSVRDKDILTLNSLIPQLNSDLNNVFIFKDKTSYFQNRHVCFSVILVYFTYSKQLFSLKTICLAISRDLCICILAFSEKINLILCQTLKSYTYL